MNMKSFAQTLDDHKHNTSVTSVRPYLILGVIVIVSTSGVFGVWASIAELMSGVVVPGKVAVRSEHRVIQHHEGGIIAEILIRDGDPVTAGQVLVRLDETAVRTQANIIDAELAVAKATEARLIAERDELDAISFPTALVVRSDEETMATAMAGQELLSQARKKTMDGQFDILNKRIDQLEKQILGVQLQADALQIQIDLTDERLSGLYELEDYVSEVVVPQEKAKRASLEGELGQQIADEVRLESQIGETRLQILQIQTDAREQVVSQIRKVQGQIHVLE